STTDSTLIPRKMRSRIADQPPCDARSRRTSHTHTAIKTISKTSGPWRPATNENSDLSKTSAPFRTPRVSRTGKSAAIPSYKRSSGSAKIRLYRDSRVARQYVYRPRDGATEAGMENEAKGGRDARG